MAQRLAKLKDKTTKGFILSSSSTTYCNDKPLVLYGDKAWCDQCKGAYPIYGTAHQMIENGKAHVQNGDRVLCLCDNNQVIATSSFFYSSESETRSSTRSSNTPQETNASTSSTHTPPPPPVMTNTLPRLLFESAREPYVDEQGKPAGDFVWQDLSRQQICDLNSAFYVKYLINDNIENDKEQIQASLFEEWRGLLTLASSGDLKADALAMMEQVKQRRGGQGDQGKYSSATLTAAVVNHAETKRFLQQVQTLFEVFLLGSHGQQSDIIKSEFEKAAQNKRSGNSFKYPNYSDPVSGLGILIHGIHGVKIKLLKYRQTSGKNYTATIGVYIYDHFGLDTNDVSTDGTDGALYGAYPGFQSWFILQHDKDYGYAPLLTEIKFEHSFSGDFSSKK